jgi:iron(III) transport system ATP-binding protein
MKLEIEGLSKTFTAGRGDSVRAVDDLSLSLDEGQFLVVLGPSGSGKTTLLRCIAGLERPDSGEIRIDGRIVYSSRARVWIPPEQRKISMVFQSYALWPHMTVFNNVAYPLRASGVHKPRIRETVMRALETVGCGQFERRYPSQLSGGQQQRVALARAIVGGSRTILFDEPLSSVDSKVREELRGELSELQRRLAFTAIYITHDQTEAVLLADQLAIFAQGQVVQLGPPRDVYANPQTEYAAEFLGAANRYAGKVVERTKAETKVETDIGPLVSVGATWNGGLGEPVAVIIRPEHCQIQASRPSRSGPNLREVVVERTRFLGYCNEYRVRLSDDVTMEVKSLEQPVLAEGTTAWIQVRPEKICLIVMGSPS